MCLSRASRRYHRWWFTGAPCDASLARALHEIIMMLPRSREQCRGRQITSPWYLTCGAQQENASNKIFVGPNLPKDKSGEPLKPKVGCTRPGFSPPPVAGVLVLNAETHSRGSRTGPGKLGLPLVMGAHLARAPFPAQPRPAKSQPEIIGSVMSE